MAINKSVIKAIEILEFISESNGITLSEIAKEMNLPMASTSDILKALLSKDMIEIADTRAKTYTIGVKNFALGHNYLNNINVVNIAIPFIDEVSKKASKTVFLGKLTDKKVMYMYKCLPETTLVSTCRVGSLAELSTTGLGKVILAYNEHLQEEVFTNPLPQKTKFSITSHEKLKSELKSVLTKGYALDKFENYENSCCVAFPIFGKNNKVEYSISISGIYVSPNDLEYEIDLGLAISKDISLRLGCSSKMFSY